MSRRPSSVRIVHLGLGAFHRSHQAWYTAHADPTWGIAAFTGRSPSAAETLKAQDGIYTLATRSAEGDHYEAITTIVAAHDASETAALRSYLTSSLVTVVTLTITEKGYRLNGDGVLNNSDPDVDADAAVLRAALATGSTIPDGSLRTAAGRLIWALAARRIALPRATLTLIPCDNLTENGAAARAAFCGMAALVDPELARWMDAYVDIVSTSVDRITPHTTPGDIDRAAEVLGRPDPALVVTEPFSSWILGGHSRAERPQWERAGAEFVDDITPFENRKLWMLNGAHSLLAYEGLSRGHTTVCDAIADPACMALVNRLWDLDEYHLIATAPHEELHLRAYRRDLDERFRNPAIAHQLRQIAVDGSVKIPNRVLAVIRLDREAGGDGAAGLAVIAAWIRFILKEVREQTPIEDVVASKLVAYATSDDPIRSLLTVLSPDLADDARALEHVTALTENAP